jgi:hypothetical protein
MTLISKTRSRHLFWALLVENFFEGIVLTVQIQVLIIAVGNLLGHRLSSRS